MTEEELRAIERYLSAPWGSPDAVRELDNVITITDRERERRENRGTK